MVFAALVYCLHRVDWKTPDVDLGLRRVYCYSRVVHRCHLSGNGRHESHFTLT